MEQLSDDEWVVLVGLARLLIHADQEISPAEQEALARLQQQAGGVRWNAAVRAARRRFPTSAALELRARDVRGDARRTIHQALAGLTPEGTPTPDVLGWVRPD